MRTFFTQERLTQLFSIDLRSLALVRIGLAVVILIDCARRIPDMFTFYGDGGVLPLSYTQLFWTGDWSWSLHLLGGGHPAVLVALFAAYVFAALALLVGWHTRIATIAVWILTVSLHNANPLILQGEDVLLRVVLFVSLFLPLGAVYSIDRWRAKKAPASHTIFSGWSVAYLLQLGFLYFFVSLYKHSEEWTGGTAIYYALSIDQYATQFGRYLLNFPDMLTVMTYCVLIFQSFALFLLFSPVYTTFVRTVTVIGLMTMHASFAASMHLGMFSSVSIVALCAFLPSPLWNTLERFFSAQFQRARVFIQSLSSTGKEIATLPHAGSAAWISLLGSIYILYIFSWHLGNVFIPGQYVPFTHGFEIPAKILRIDQRWNLFAPYPYRHDGWIVIPGVLNNGEQVDVFRPDTLLSFERPPVVYESYPRPRWRRYFLSLWIEDNARYRVPYAEYLCRTWNETHEGDEQLKQLHVVYEVEWTPAPGEATQPVRPVSLIAWDCTKNEPLATQD